MNLTARSPLPFRWNLLTALCWPVVGGLLGLALGTAERSLWPGDILAIPFTDTDKMGHSTAEIDTTNGVLRLSVRLDSGAQYPLAGGILFLSRDSNVVDMSGQGTLELRFGTSDIPALKVCLVEELPGFTRNDAWQTARYECTDIELLPGTPVYRIPLEKFITPPWWNVASGLRTSQIGPEKRERIVRLILQTAEGSPLYKKHDLRIQGIVLRQERPWAVPAGLGIGLLLALFQLFLVRRRSLPAADVVVHQPQIAPVVFQPIEARSYSDREREAVVECIGRDYVDPELSLEKVSRSTGVPLDRVTSHVKAASGLLFKAYLNRVRGEAAHKLLLETDLPVSEIAMKVGYGSPPHFNRVFRELYGTTPTALREGNAAPPAATTETDEEG
jgi:AraC-like DNA-binding protein